MIKDDGSRQDEQGETNGQVPATQKENLVLVAHDEKTLCYLVEEAGCRGVLDSGCS